jgi:hypothetical protein
VVLLCVLVTLSCSMFRNIAPQNQWSERWGPMVPHTTFPGDCSLCHYPDRWDRLKEDFAFDHAIETGYPLVGGHAAAACLRCHNDRGPVQAYLARGCGGCHEDPHGSELGLDCTQCHVEYTWDPIGLVAEHNRTRFPLVASHALAPCESCHAGATVGDFRGAPVECHLCHQREALLAQPNHVVNGWIRNCQDCHDVASWVSVNFDHSAFPLVGGHAGVDCLRCHIGGRIQGTPTDCSTCHTNDYLAAPNHVAGNFSTNCTDCHNTTAWK